MKALFIRPNIDAFGFKPMGLSLLIAYIKSHGIEADLYDMTFQDFGYTDNNTGGEKAKYFQPTGMEEYGHVKSERHIDIDANEYDVFYMSVLTSEVPVAKLMIKEIKSQNPDARIVIGGKHVTFTGDQDFPEVDAYRGNLLTHPDGFPYLDWSLYDDAQFWRPYKGKAVRAGDHASSFGCVNKCTYCCNEFYGNKVTRYSVGRWLDEIEHLQKTYGIEFWKFHDEDIGLRPLKELKELSVKYAKKIKTPFTTEINARNVTQEKVYILRDMGCVNISMGVESGSEWLRKQVLQRRETTTELYNAFRLFRDAGVSTTAFNMIGLPFDSEETYADTVKLNAELNPDAPLMAFFYPYPGTRLMEVSKAMGFWKPNGWQVHHWSKPALTLPGLTEERLIEMRETFADNVRENNR